MKHKKTILVLLLMVVALLVAFLLQTSSATSLFYRETATEDSIRASWLYLNEERTYTFQIDAKTYGCVEVETNGGTYWLEVIDADGKYHYSTVGQEGSKTWLFSSDQDVTVNLTLYKHSGGCHIYISDEPIY